MKRLAKGFTLIELMIVVAIIGILAAIAIPNFVKYQLRSKFSEGTTNLEGLRKAQEALRQGERKITIDDGTGALILVPTYKSGMYWHGQGAVAPAWPWPSINAPATGTGSDKIVWDRTELAAAQGMDWQVEGATYFQYQVSVEGCVTDNTFPDAAQCYFAAAWSDIDADKNNATGGPGEIALNRPSLDMSVEAVQPAGMINAFPGDAAGSCQDNNANPVYAMPCTLSGPDRF